MERPTDLRKGLDAFVYHYDADYWVFPHIQPKLAMTMHVA